MHKSSLLHTFIKAVVSESSSALFKVITGLMSRKGASCYRLISVYYQGCGLMSAQPDCVLIQGLDLCQVLACGSRVGFLCELCSLFFFFFFIMREGIWFLGHRSIRSCQYAAT